MSTDYFQGEVTFPIKYLEPLGFRSLSPIGGKRWIADLERFLLDYIQLDSIGENELNIEAGLLTITAFEARYGGLENLEDWLRSAKVPFDARTHEYFEYKAESRYYRPDTNTTKSVDDSACNISLTEALEIVERIDDRGLIREELLNRLCATKPATPLSWWIDHGR